MEWPRGEATDCKSVYTGSNPVSTSIARSSAVWDFGTSRAIGAAVARFLDTEEVTGSNPVSPTSTPPVVTCGDERFRRSPCADAAKVEAITCTSQGLRNRRDDRGLGGRPGSARWSVDQPHSPHRGVHPHGVARGPRRRSRSVPSPRSPHRCAAADRFPQAEALPPSDIVGVLDGVELDEGDAEVADLGQQAV